jgi:uncharacterized protein
MSRDSSQAYPLDRTGDPLTFALSGLMAEAPGTVREYPLGPADLTVDEDVVLTRPVTGRVRLSRTNRGLVVEALVATAMGGECARCLRPVEVPVEARIDEEVLPTIDLASGQPVPLEEGADPEAPRLTDHHELELRPLVAEAVSLQEPIAFLCEPDCPGLCPECGQRMEAGHGHGDGPIDPRLEALRAFRFDADRENG